MDGSGYVHVWDEAAAEASRRAVACFSHARSTAQTRVPLPNWPQSPPITISDKSLGQPQEVDPSARYHSGRSGAYEDAVHNQHTAGRRAETYRE